MIQGIVNARWEATLVLRVYGPAGAAGDVSVVVDTGFTGALALTPTAIASLNLTWWTRSQVTLADGTAQEFDVYEAEVEWDGRRRPVLVAGMGGDALVGTRLMAGHELRIEFASGGPVEVQPLSVPLPLPPPSP